MQSLAYSSNLSLWASLAVKRSFSRFFFILGAAVLERVSDLIPSIGESKDISQDFLVLPNSSNPGLRSAVVARRGF